MQSLLQYRRIRLDILSDGLPNPNPVSKRSGFNSNGTLHPNENRSEVVRQTVIDASNQDLEKAAELEASPYTVVGFDNDCDPLNPQNWSYRYKWTVTGLVSITSFIVTGASAIDSEIAPQLMQSFGVGEEVALLGTALFMIAFGLGSLVSAPFSEVLGRNPVYLASKLPYIITRGPVRFAYVCRSRHSRPFHPGRRAFTKYRLVACVPLLRWSIRLSSSHQLWRHNSGLMVPDPAHLRVPHSSLPLFPWTFSGTNGGCVHRS